MDRQFTVSGNWALASDGLQWMLQRRHKRPTGDTWDGMSFVRSEKEILARCMREKGTPQKDADNLLAGLPSTYAEWAAETDGTTGGGV
jgi:hypothetical protein